MEMKKKTCPGMHESEPNRMHTDRELRDTNIILAPLSRLLFKRNIGLKKEKEKKRAVAEELPSQGWRLTRKSINRWSGRVRRRHERGDAGK